MVNLEVKRPAHLVPSYSLTGDLLSFLRCHLQYRYYNGSSLPPSRPVQLWYGEFVHGVLEAAYRTWQTSAPRPPFPWPCSMTQWNTTPPPRPAHDIGELGDRIEHVLRAQGKEARSRAAREAAYRRATVAVNELGPLLFPIIADAETKVIGTRTLPHIAGRPQIRAERYEVHGVIDVVTQLSLASVPTNNALRAGIEAACGTNLPHEFEIIVDYKGAARPNVGADYWVHGDWQVQTYAWLRQHQAEQIPIVAGILLYIDELAPGTDNIEAIQKQIKKGVTDVVPAPGSQDEKILRNWKSGQSTNQLSLEFRLRRAIRVIPITAASLLTATSSFDNVVRNIEENIEHEFSIGAIPNAWQANCRDEATCAACDFRHFCPSPGPHNKPVALMPAHAP
jgi:hypothetical protein